AANRMHNLQNRMNTRRAFLALRNPEYASTIKVITVVRSPIEQILSHYFHSAVYERQFEHLGIEVTPANARAALLVGVAAFMSNPERTLDDLKAQLSSRTGGGAFWFCWFVYNYLTWFEAEFRRFFPAKIIGGRMKDGY